MTAGKTVDHMAGSECVGPGKPAMLEISIKDAIDEDKRAHRCVDQTPSGSRAQGFQMVPSCQVAVQLYTHHDQGHAELTLSPTDICLAYSRTSHRVGSTVDTGPRRLSSHQRFYIDLSEELMLLNCGVGEDSCDSLGLQGDPTTPSQRRSVLSVYWKDWCWSWNSNPLDTWCKELMHWKRPWCWERLKAGGEGDDRGWDGWMASPTRWTWVWANSGRGWWTGKAGVLQSMGSQRVGHNWETELNGTDPCHRIKSL